MGDSRHAITTFDKKFEIFHLEHFHLKNRCSVHVYIYTAWATRDMRSPLLTKNSKFFILEHFHFKNRCLVHVYIYTAWATRYLKSPLLTKN